MSSLFPLGSQPPVCEDKHGDEKIVRRCNQKGFCGDFALTPSNTQITKCNYQWNKWKDELNKDIYMNIQNRAKRLLSYIKSKFCIISEGTIKKMLIRDQTKGMECHKQIRGIRWGNRSRNRLPHRGSIFYMIRK